MIKSIAFRMIKIYEKVPCPSIDYSLNAYDIFAFVFQRFSFNKISDPGRKIISTQPQKVSSRKLDRSTFTNSGYIIPLENNAAGSIYSSKAQIRGVIKKWDKLSALIIVGKEEKTVWFPSEIHAYCFQEQ